ncbi:hypothetical protein BaRGS_00004609 [Batillaria attramentaria]|uniref:Uncharacterized protein n=1 Tax=Batillaria attramentaria TaxID=370345 RepID=A0ABD0LXD1_9CAEN
MTTAELVFKSSLSSTSGQSTVKLEPCWLQRDMWSPPDTTDTCSMDSDRITQSATPTSSTTNDVKLPKNAVELIATAIEKCDTPYPTVTQMATYIHDNVSTYHDQDLTILVKMVHHHLSRDTNNYFLPVMMSGQTSHNPASCRWALNRQAVVVSVDGSLMRRRFHPYPYRQYTGSPYTPATASPSVLISPSGSKTASSSPLPMPTFPTATYGPSYVSGMPGTMVAAGSKVVSGPMPRFSSMTGRMYGSPVSGTNIKSPSGVTYLSMY